MARKKNEISALHEWHFIEVLTQLGLITDGITSLVKCAICNRDISIEEIGGLLVGKSGGHSVVCSDANCLTIAGNKKDG